MSTRFSDWRRPDPLARTPNAVLRQLLDVFSSRIRDDKDALNELFPSLSELDAVHCTYCGSTDLEPPMGGHEVTCRSCLKRTSFTSGTFFENCRRIHARLFAISLLQAGFAFSANQFHKVMEISYDTAWHIKKEIELALEKEQFGQTEEVPSEYLLPIICKRSTETPARKAPAAEEDVAQSEQAAVRQDWGLPTEQKQNTPDSAEIGERDVADEESPHEECAEDRLGLTEIEAAIYNLLGNEPVHIDMLLHTLSGYKTGLVLGSLLTLELRKLVDRLPGDRYLRRSRRMQMEEINDKALDAVAAAIVFIGNLSHGASRKYAQLAVAFFSFLATNTFLKPNSVLQACLRLGPVTSNQIRAYVSPLIIQLSMA